MTLADDALLDRYDRTYGRTPAKAASRLQLAQKELELARRQEDTRRGADVLRMIRALEGVLDRHQCCHRCGRHLQHPDPDRPGLGPECSKRPAL